MKNLTKYFHTKFLTPNIKRKLSLVEFFISSFYCRGLLIYKNMKAKVLYTIEQDQFIQIHRVYLETHFNQAEKDFEMLKDVATTSEIYLDDVDCYGDENNG